MTINADEFNRVCKLSGLIEGKGFWKTHDNKEIVEIRGDKIVTSYYINGERQYGLPVISSHILAVMGAFEKDSRPEEQPKTKETEIGTQQTTSLINSIPQILTNDRIMTKFDLEEWQKMSVFERLFLFQKSAQGIVRKRRGFLLPASANKTKKDLTDKDYQMFQYVPANIKKLELNIIFLFDWSAVVESEKYFDNEVCVRGYVQIRINDNIVRRPCGGSCVKKGMMDWGDTMEGAISEMIKRGADSFGINGDVKRGEYEELFGGEI